MFQLLELPVHYCVSLIIIRHDYWFIMSYKLCPIYPLPHHYNQLFLLLLVDLYSNLHMKVCFLFKSFSYLSLDCYFPFIWCQRGCYSTPWITKMHRWRMQQEKCQGRFPVDSVTLLRRRSVVFDLSQDRKSKSKI